MVNLKNLFIFMFLNKLTNADDYMIFVLCMGNINIGDTTILTRIQPQPIGINVLHPGSFNIQMKISYKEYHEQLSNTIKKPIALNRHFKSKTLNDLTYLYRNALKTNKSVNSLVKLLKRLLNAIQRKDGVLFIIYDNYISSTEKQILRLLFQLDQNYIKSLEFKYIIFHHNSENNYYIFKFDDKIFNDAITHVFSKHIDIDKEVKQQFKATSEIPVKQIKLSKITSILANVDSLPKQKRSELYDKITDMIIDIFTALGLEIKDISYETINNVTDVQGSIYRKYTITFKLPYGETDQIELNIPEMIGDSYFYLNGTRRALQYQMLNNPIIVIKPNHVKLHTLYASVTLKKTGKKKPVYTMYAGGLNMNPILVFLSQNRLEKFAELFGIKFRFEESK